ncbi:MAG: PmoA family protein [Bacteroidales bacterium]|nr:PmoA family protein [Bacteroidales bacterium]
MECFAQSAKLPVAFREVANERKVDVYLGGSFFTAFLYPENMEKAVLFPILSPQGKPVTRGYPLKPRSFERTDHPHHVGLWFNFGDVNGLDYWNNSFAVTEDKKKNYGSIVTTGIVAKRPRVGQLQVVSEWQNSAHKACLRENTTYTFSGNAKMRCIVRKATLHALETVTFTENKEGMLGLRVARTFEEPDSKPAVFTDANGIETTVSAVNDADANGIYRNREGLVGAEVWGKRSQWVALRADNGGEITTIVIIDHPKNPNYPAWSHARGYGLFAINSLGGRAFDKNTDMVKITMNPGDELTFSYQIIIGGDLSDSEINTIAKKFR